MQTDQYTSDAWRVEDSDGERKLIACSFADRPKNAHLLVEVDEPAYVVRKDGRKYRFYVRDADGSPYVIVTLVDKLLTIDEQFDARDYVAIKKTLDECLMDVMQCEWGVCVVHDGSAAVGGIEPYVRFELDGVHVAVIQLNKRAF